MPAKKTSAKTKSVKAKTATATRAKSETESSKPKPSNGKVAAFTLDDVQSLLKTKKPEESNSTAKGTKKVAKKKAKVEVEDIPHQVQSFGAASLADILGYNPTTETNHRENDEKKVPKKFKVYYKLLVSLRNHVNEELDLHTRETLKKSNKDDSGDIASYSQHMADEGTDNFDRDFALSLVSSEHEALSEIEEAIGRIFDSTYGTCEITGEPISKERLLAVPFTKHSLEGQQQLEKYKRFSVQRGGVFSTGIEDSAQFIANDDGD
ncbi:MAG: TraR/DksA C4-type zinc finger protein [Verrucomicrobia bacterium]|nr:TraR/DksA C4-type zinc finger protein [Verrucomicrobiota bacterium]